MQQGNKCAAKPRGRHVSSSRGGRKRNASRAGGKRAGRRTANRPTERAPHRDVKGHTQTRPAHTTDGARGKEPANCAVSSPNAPSHTQQEMTRACASHKRSDQAYSVPLPKRPTPLPPTPTRLGCPPLKKNQTGRDGGQTQLRPHASPPPPLPPTPSPPPPNIPDPSRLSGRSPHLASPKPTPPPPRQHRRSPPLALPPPPPHATPPNRPTAGSVGSGGRWQGHRDGAPRWRDPAHRSPPPGAAARWPAQPRPPAHHPSTPPVHSPTLFPRCRSPPRSPSTPPTPPPPRLPPPTPRALPRQHRRCRRWRPPTEGAARPTRRRRCGTGGKGAGGGGGAAAGAPSLAAACGSATRTLHARWGGGGGRRGWVGGSRGRGRGPLPPRRHRF